MPARRRATAKKSSAKSKKWVYLFADGKAEGNAKMRSLLGGKGAGIAEMTNASLPVPPGFTITTEACNAYFASGKTSAGLWDQVGRRSRRREVPKNSAATEEPALVSSLPAPDGHVAMMETVLTSLTDERNCSREAHDKPD